MPQSSRRLSRRQKHQQLIKYVFSRKISLFLLTSSQVKYSPSENESPPRTLIDAACAHSVTLLRNCRDSIQENVTHAMSALGQAFSTVLSAFRPSGKEKGPSSVYGDL